MPAGFGICAVAEHSFWFLSGRHPVLVYIIMACRKSSVWTRSIMPNRAALTVEVTKCWVCSPLTMVISPLLLCRASKLWESVCVCGAESAVEMHTGTLSNSLICIRVAKNNKFICAVLTRNCVLIIPIQFHYNSCILTPLIVLEKCTNATLHAASLLNSPSMVTSLSSVGAACFLQAIFKHSSKKKVLRSLIRYSLNNKHSAVYCDEQFVEISDIYQRHCGNF